MAKHEGSEMDGRGMAVEHYSATDKSGLEIKLHSDDTWTLAIEEDDGSWAETTEADLAEIFSMNELRELAKLAVAVCDESSRVKAAVAAGDEGG